MEPSFDRWPLSTVSAPGWEVEYVDSVGSTNVVARERPPGTVVVTDHQTAGRGRLDREWETPAGVALTFSAVLDPQQPDAAWPWLPLLVGVVVAETLRELEVPADLKWPNDVLVGGQKLAGILVERTATTGQGGPRAVVGVGLNVHQTELPLPSATSLALQGRTADRSELMTSILAGYLTRLADWRAAGGAERLHAAYLRRCVTVGRDVVVHLPGEGRLVGRATGIDGQGRLLVEDEQGVAHSVGAGDVVHVR